MHTFKYNLSSYLEKEQLTKEELAELAGLTPNQLAELTETESIRLAAIFCANLGIKLSSIFSDNGFEFAAFEDQFEQYPDALKKAATRAVFKKLSKIAGSEDLIKAALLRVCTHSKTTISRWMTGSSCFSRTDFAWISRALSAYITPQKFKELAASELFIRVPNYNLMLYRIKYNINNNQLGYICKQSSSLCSNWAGSFTVPVGTNHVAELAQFLNVLEENFISTILTIPKGHTINTEMLKGYSKSKSKSDSDRDGSSLMKSCIEEVEKKQTLSLPDPISNEKHLFDEEHLPDEASNAVTVTVDHDKMWKMFNKLPVSKQAEIRKMIVDEFFSMTVDEL